MSIDREESLFLTVSEDHSRRDYPEFIHAMCDPYREAGGMIAVYEGALLGGADKLFGLEELNRWLWRHKYAAYKMELLLPITHMCLEYAVRKQMAEKRPGIAVLAERAAEELLRDDPLQFRYSSRNWVTIYWLAEEFPRAITAETQIILNQLDGFTEGVLPQFLELTRASAACADAQALVEQAVSLYKRIFTKYFAPDHSEDLPSQLDWLDGDGEAQAESDGDGDAILQSQLEEEQTEMELRYDKATKASLGDDFTMTDEMLAAIPDYLAKTFGPSFKTRKEMDEIENTICVDIHENRKLLFTDGLPESAYEEAGSRSASLKAGRDANLQMLEAHQDSARQSIRSIEQAFRNALNLKADPDIYRADRGTLVNSVLWKVGRVDDPQLFQKTFQRDDSTIVVELLIDASGSQAARQPMVALQSYLFSSALSRIRIPHRVMSYCTYGDHTVLRRFRDYDDDAEADARILEYRAASNNRDGLALAAAGIDLLKRREENKIVIMFSDGLPNDMVSGKVKAGMPKKYIGDTAIKDTCAQIRKLRRSGVHVIGIFLGNDNELENERMIYGSSFLRIRRAEDFGGTAGKRLSDTLLQL